MRMNEIRERTDEELGRLAHQLEGDLFKFRVQRHTSQLANPMLLRESRRTLARVLTVVSARAHGLETAGAPSAVAAGARPAPAVLAARGAPEPAQTAARPKAAAPAKPANATKAARPAAKAKPPAKGAKPREAKALTVSRRAASPKTRKSASGRSTRGGK